AQAGSATGLRIIKRPMRDFLIFAKNLDALEPVLVLEVLVDVPCRVSIVSARSPLSDKPPIKLGWRCLARNHFECDANVHHSLLILSRILSNANRVEGGLTAAGSRPDVTRFEEVLALLVSESFGVGAFGFQKLCDVSAAKTPR